MIIRVKINIFLALEQGQTPIREKMSLNKKLRAFVSYK